MAGTGESLRAGNLIWNVPYERNRFFTGREPLLAEIRQRFEQSGSHVQALFGLGGIGKTQLALEYAHRHRDAYAIVWWLAAEDRSTLELLYSRLASRLNLNFAHGANLDAIRHLLRRVLSDRSDWLLIFDNAPSAEAIADFIPLHPKGHVLITSRSPYWHGVARDVQVHEPSRQESIAFLRRRTQRNEQELIVNRLAQALGDLPLAMEQAAATIVQTGITFAEYLMRFERHWVELLQQGPSRRDYPDSLAMAWELSFRQIEEDTPEAARLLNLCAYMGHEEIPRGIITKGAAALPQSLAETARNPVLLDEAVTALRRFSLVSSNEKSLWLHRLVSAVARDRLSDEERRQWADAAVRIVGRSFSFDGQDPSTWSEANLLLPHALAAADHAQELGVATDVAASVLNDVGRILLKRARFSEAQRALQQSFELTHKMVGSEHPKVSGVSNNLGRVLLHLGQPHEARPHFERALRIDQTLYGPNDLRVATLANNYGMCLHSIGELELARQQFEFALGVYQANYGDASPKVPSVMSNLGFIMMIQREYEPAEQMLASAHHLAESTCGTNHPIVASVLHNLGTLMRRTGRYPLAQDYLQRALDIDEAMHGPRHPDVARHFSELGAVMRELGQTHDARQHLERALDITREFFGDAHQQTRNLRESLRAVG
jgi:Tfp pilus assembly protein PilF